jgi:hypothetical protein
MASLLFVPGIIFCRNVTHFSHGVGCCVGMDGVEVGRCFVGIRIVQKDILNCTDDLPDQEPNNHKLNPHLLYTKSMLVL